MFRMALTQTVWRALAAVCILLLIFLVASPYRSSDIADLASTIFDKIPPNSSTTPKSPETQTADRPLILYAYSETENAHQNLEFFLQRGLHGKADFIFILNGPHNVSGLIPTDKPNVRVVERKNVCFDLGAYGQVLMMEDNLLKRYKRFLMVNASVRGPFLPVYSGECWSDVFFNRVTEAVKLVGLSYNCIPRPHLQSMVLATDAEGMRILLDPQLGRALRVKDYFGELDDGTGLTICYEEMKKAVHGEIGLTALMRSQGYEVDAMMTSFQAASMPSRYCEDFDNPPEAQYDHMYFGTNLHPYETVFFKANRAIDPVTLEDMTKWHLGMKTNAWDTCGR